MEEDVGVTLVAKLVILVRNAQKREIQFQKLSISRSPGPCPHSIKGNIGREVATLNFIKIPSL